MGDPEPPFDANATAVMLRKDPGARKIIDRLDSQLGRPDADTPSLRDEVIALKASTVKYDRLMAIIGAAATVIVSAAWKVQTDNLSRAEAIHAADMRNFRDDVHEELRRAALYSAGTYSVVVEKRPPVVVAQEVRAAATDAGVR